MNLKSHKILSLLILTLLVIITGCSDRIVYSPKDEAKFQKPTIGVLSFDNRAPLHVKWNIGDGMSDILVDRLINTNRYIVLDRQNLSAIMDELERTQDSRFRKRGGPQTGRLKNLKYFVKGTITDFGHVETVTVAFQENPKPAAEPPQ